MRRTPLATLQGGTIRRAGDPRIALRLARALDVAGDAALAELTHGFHSYPARMHPHVARRLLDDKTLPLKARVLDPFCGSGTTLVEAARRGATGLGVDLNPLAVALAHLKSSVWSKARQKALAAAAETVVATMQDKVRASRSRRQAPPREPSPATRFDDPRLYPKHVFPELVALRLTIDEACQNDPELTMALRLVLSSIVIKVSLQASDTDETIVEKTIARGAATRHFGRRAAELLDRLHHFAEAVPRGTPPTNVRIGDARHLEHIEAGSIDALVSSPPYLNTYDYTRHHMRRMGWLSLPPGTLRGGEIGARRVGAAGDPMRALTAWRKDMGDCLKEIARVLRPGAFAYLLVGDASLSAQTPPADEELNKLGLAAGLHVIARAAQQRGVGRYEHLVAFRRK